MRKSRPVGRIARHLPLGVLSVLILWVWARPTAADVFELQASKDNTLYSESDFLSNGSGAYFFSGRTAGVDVRRALVAFDLSPIPSGSSISSATLTLFVSRTQAANKKIGAHRVTADWGEGASNASGQEGGGAAAELSDATWRYTFYDPASPGLSPQWSSPGGDFLGTASATVSVGAANNFYAWSSTGMVVDVQFWIDTPATNFGWILVGNETSSPSGKPHALP